MGYNTDRFVEKQIEDEFICSICHDVLKDPVLVETCEHTFCANCIQHWIKNNRTCPIDRSEIQNIHLHQPQRSFKSLLGKLKISCDFDKLGCSAVLKLDDLRNHCDNCDFNPNLKRECKSGCGAKLSRYEREKHNCIKYLKDKLSSMSTKDTIVETQQNSTKKAIFERARKARSNPKFYRNQMDEQMTKEVIEIVADSIAKIDHWWHAGNDIRRKLDSKYGPFWGCCLSGGARIVAITIADKKYYLEFLFSDLSVVIWKNA